MPGVLDLGSSSRPKLADDKPLVGVEAVATRDVVQLEEKRPEIVVKMPGWIESALQERYADRRPIWGEARPVTKGWTPSALGEPNDRMLLAGYLGYRGDPISEKLQRIFDMGNDIEARWVKRFGDIEVLIAHGSRLPRQSRTDVKISGIVDIIVKHKLNPQQRFLVEVKSINPNGFGSLPPVQADPLENYRSLMETKGTVGERIYRYMHQLQVYLYEMGMNDGILLFDNKGNQDYADYHVRLDEGLIATAYGRLRRLQEYWEQGLLPPWNGSPKSKSFFATHRPTEAVPVAEFRSHFEGMAAL